MEQKNRFSKTSFVEIVKLQNKKLKNTLPFFRKMSEIHFGMFDFKKLIIINAILL